MKALLTECQGAIAHLLELLPPIPEESCSCHISPPCHDCVTNSWPRSVERDARETIKKLQAALLLLK